MKKVEKKYLLKIPKANSNLDVIFLELNKKNIEELDTYFIPNLSSIDALRVILYKFSLSILLYKDRILSTNDTEDLHQFRINLRKSRAFLKEFRFLLSKKHYKYFYNNITNFATQTNQKRDLDVIEKYFKELNKNYKMIKKDIKLKQKYEDQHIQEMLKSRVFKDFFYTYHDILTSKTLHTSESTTKNMKKSAKQVIAYLHHEIIQKINVLEKNFKPNKLHKIRISLKKFRYLLEEFQDIFGEEKIEKMIEKGKKLQTILGDFNDTVNQEKLLHNYFKENKKKLPEGKKLEHKLLDKTIHRQEKLKLQAMKKLHEFKKKPLKF